MTLTESFTYLKQQFNKDPYPSIGQRKKKLKTLLKLIRQQKSKLATAANLDFGFRSESETFLLELAPSVEQIGYTLGNLKYWMEPEIRHAGILHWPVHLEVVYQPLGMVGIIVPWNYPIYLALGPMITALAAGNKVMIKTSEFTPHVGNLLKELLEAEYPNDVRVFTGGVDEAIAFTALPWDHLFFTGSTAVGSLVMQSAAKNLSPVTLELGGKSPVIIDAQYPLKTLSPRLLFGKVVNSGQTCVAPDYVFVPQNRLDSLIELLKKDFQKFYPNWIENSDYSSLIHQKHLDRIRQMLLDAENSGCKIIPLTDPPMDLNKRKMALHLVINPSDSLSLMKEEIFGPLLPIKTYEKIEDVFEFISKRPRPLALYLFSSDNKLIEKCSYQLHSGNLIVNDTLLHIAQDDLPFGGVGASGMGAYHGIEGFKTFSHAKGVLRRPRISTALFVYPPLKSWFHKFLQKFLLR